MKAININKYCG